MSGELEARCSTSVSGVPSESSVAIAADVRAFEDALRHTGMAGGLRFLSLRTSHRFTGVFRFDGDTLRSVALVDKWLPGVERGDDLPLAEAYCAHLKATGEPLTVTDGRSDPRLPWMTNSGVASYCGALIRDEKGDAWGALCHFDPNPCEAKDSAMPLLVAAAALIHRSTTGN